MQGFGILYPFYIIIMNKQTEEHTHALKFIICLGNVMQVVIYCIYLILGINYINNSRGRVVNIRELVY